MMGVEGIESFLQNTTHGDIRALSMNAGNFSVTFVPLITLMAQYIPRILTRIKQMRPTQTVSSREYRSSKIYSNNNVMDLCSSSTSALEFKNFPGDSKIFYTCKFKEFPPNNCNIKQVDHLHENHVNPIHNFKIGKLIGLNECYEVHLFKCNEEQIFDEKKGYCRLPDENKIKFKGFS